VKVKAARGDSETRCSCFQRAFEKSASVAGDENLSWAEGPRICACLVAQFLRRMGNAHKRDAPVITATQWGTVGEGGGGGGRRFLTYGLPACCWLFPVRLADIKMPQSRAAHQKWEQAKMRLYSGGKGREWLCG